MTWTADNPGPLVAFSGSRKFRDRPLIEELMRRLVARWPHMLVRVGDAKHGVDPIVAHEATRWGKWPDVQECYWPPEPATKRMRWEAAHERNGRVLEGAAALIAVYAPGPKTSGTTDAVKQARERGIPVYTYHEGRWTVPAIPSRAGCGMRLWHEDYVWFENTRHGARMGGKVFWSGLVESA